MQGVGAGCGFRAQDVGARCGCSVWAQGVSVGCGCVFTPRRGDSCVGCIGGMALHLSPEIRKVCTLHERILLSL